MNQKQKLFVDTVWEFYETHGRHDLPWRKAITPYKILVSEIMLQQTQVDRVIPKYKAFMKQFPSLTALAKAPAKDVIAAWSGLGYNRRALNLQKAAQEVRTRYNGRLPDSYDILITLPGIGPYTAAAILAFAYNIPHPTLETNIRTVFIFHFFKHAKEVHDNDLMQHVIATLPTENIREWYWALMDYGSHLKKVHGNISRQSRHHTKQKPFKGSDREIRGGILKALIEKPMNTRQLVTTLKKDKERIKAQLQKLHTEDLITKNGSTWLLP